MSVIKPKANNVAGTVPTITGGTPDLEDGEFAVNTADQKIYIRDGSSLKTLGIVNTQQFIPSADSTYDLGSSTNKWRDLHIAGGSIKMGTSIISVSATGEIQTTKSGGTAETMVTTGSSEITFKKQDGSTSNISAFTQGNSSIENALVNRYVPFKNQVGTAITTIPVE